MDSNLTLFVQGMTHYTEAADLALKAYRDQDETLLEQARAAVAAGDADLGDAASLMAAMQ